MKHECPEIATGMIYRGSRYRVDGYYKTVPVRPPKRAKNAERSQLEIVCDEIYDNIFLKFHPDWHHEYRLIPCLKDEATHIAGYSVGSCIVSLSDNRVTFDYTNIGWSDEVINQHKQHWFDYANRSEPPYEIIKGRWHK